MDQGNSSWKRAFPPSQFFPKPHPTNSNHLSSLHQQTGKKHNHLAYRGTVKVIEPEKNYFDLSLLSVYLIVILFAIGTIYIALQAFNKPSETKISTSQPKKQERSRPTPTPVKGESSSKSFDESWIPEEHLRNRKARTGAGAASSGDEEGNLSSGGGKRRNRK